jgi:hypothetical protein
MQGIVTGVSSRATSSTSTPSVEFFAEYRARLRVIQLFLTCSGWDEASGMIRVSVAPENGQTATIRLEEIQHAGDRNIKTVSYDLLLPVKADPQTLITPVSLSLNGEHSFKLRALPNLEAENSQLGHEPIRPPLSAQELQSSHPTSFACASCSIKLFNLPTNVIYRNLPSAHWREIADAWLCHPKGGDDFTERYSKKMEEGFWPSEDVVLVGLWDIWVDGSLVSADYTGDALKPVGSRPSLPLHSSSFSLPGIQRRSQPNSSKLSSLRDRNGFIVHRYKCPISTSTYAWHTGPTCGHTEPLLREEVLRSCRWNLNCD